MTMTVSREQSIRKAGYYMLRGDRDWVERVIARAITEDTSIYHAYWLDEMDRLDDMPKCLICDGRITNTMPASHWLCVARQKRGVATPPMDYVPTCGCGPCRDKDLTNG